MVSSLRFRLLVAMVLLPVVALASVGVAMTWTTQSRLDDSFRFTVVPVSKPGQGGLRTVGEDDFPIDVESSPPEKTSTNPLIYEPETGDAYLLRAEPGFVAAYRDDQREAIASLNRHRAVAVAAVSVVATVVAYGLSRRVLGPVESSRARHGSSKLATSASAWPCVREMRSESWGTPSIPWRRVLSATRACGNR
jgi:hypothetical protein